MFSMRLLWLFCLSLIFFVHCSEAQKASGFHYKATQATMAPLLIPDDPGSGSGGSGGKVNKTGRSGVGGRSYRLQNPTEVPEGEHREVAYIVTNVPTVLNTRKCTGVLIAPRWVLTAAHCGCTEDSWGDNQCADRTQARFGVDAVASINGDFIPHPGYNPNLTTPIRHDIALIHLDDIPPPGIVPARLYFGGDATYLSTSRLVLFGYGYRGAKCNIRPPRFMSLGRGETNLITISGNLMRYKHTTCGGDSGGPIYNAYENRVLGIISGWYNPPLILDDYGNGPYLKAYEGWIRSYTCTNRNPSQYNFWNKCNDSLPLCQCNKGQGDCDFDVDCRGGLTCLHDRGDRFGLSRSADVCWPPNLSIPPVCSVENCNK